MLVYIFLFRRLQWGVGRQGLEYLHPRRTFPLPLLTFPPCLLPPSSFTKSSP
ncbi:unnamed protein product [Spirodela intermedia]|uniref:Uncharacterized protein n=1 Tax=Spirodela intermedia TaxID=51605 RepID=A0A7I8J4V3_SPIIN|nr:unnamed protein product [Spirodela intermedia]CAA6664795.1 unnamed protein product [Spirodela intermedia]